VDFAHQIITGTAFRWTFIAIGYVLGSAATFTLMKRFGIEATIVTQCGVTFLIMVMQFISFQNESRHHARMHQELAGKLLEQIDAERKKSELGDSSHDGERRWQKHE
jgi:hypothetical protein